MQGSREVDHRADIYSQGVVFYELLTGELPMGKFAPPSRKVQVDVRLDEIVLRALEQEPEQRYQHASEIKTDVDNVVRSNPESKSVAPAAEYVASEIIAGAATGQPSPLAPLPRFFWLRAFGALTLGWIAVAVLWNYGLTGFLLGSVVMAAVTLQIGRSHANRNPQWVATLHAHSPARRFLTLFFNLSGLAILLLIFISGLFVLWESSKTRENHFAPTSEAFEAQYKGKEYQLIRRLDAFKDQLPTVELVKDYIGTTSLERIATPIVWIPIIYSLLSLFFFFQQSAGTQAHVVRGLRRGGWKPALASSGTFLASVMCALAGLLFSALFFLNGRHLTTVNNTVVVHANVNQVSNALHQWAAEHNCDSGSNRWGIQTVPKGEQVAKVEVFSAWKNSPFERWRMTPFGLNRPFPYIAVQIIGSENPVQSEVMIFSGGYPDGLVEVGSDKQKQWQGIIQSLSDAVSKAQDFDASVMHIVKPAASHPETGSMWPGLCSVLAAIVLWIFVTIRYLTPEPPVGIKPSTGRANRQPVSSAILTSSVPRFSRLALWGAIWAPAFFIMALLFFMLVPVPLPAAGQPHTGPAAWQILLRFTLLPLGMLAPFGTTVLGTIAIAQIKLSHGRLYGLELAIIDAIIFPLFALFLILTASISYVLIAVASTQLQAGQAVNGTMFLAVSTLAALVVCLFVGRAAWRAIMPTAEINSPAKDVAKQAELRISSGLLAACVIGIAGCLWPYSVVEDRFLGLVTHGERPPRSGVVIDPHSFGEIWEHTPAAKAGIIKGDTILSMHGKQVHVWGLDNPDWIWKSTPIGTDVEMTVLRNDQEITLHIARSPDQITFCFYSRWQFMAGLCFLLFTVYSLLGESVGHAFRWRGVVASVLGLLLMLILVSGSDTFLNRPAKVLWNLYSFEFNDSSTAYAQKITAGSAALALLLLGILDIRRVRGRYTPSAGSPPGSG